jgi:hypothetical protein
MAVMTSTTPATIFSPVTLTVTFTNNTSSAQSGFGIGFTPLPTANGSPGVMTIAPNPKLSNHCNNPGSAVSANPGQNSFQITGVSLATGGSCSVSVDLSASGTGVYGLTNYTFLGGTSPTGASGGAPLVWDDYTGSYAIAIVPPGDELYVPEPAGTTDPGGSPVAAGVRVFNPSNGALDCTITSSSIPDPQVVAVSPYNGKIYVYDHQNQTISVFPYQSGCTGGANLALTSSPAPLVPSSVVDTVVGMAVANNGNLVVSGHTSAYETTDVGPSPGKQLGMTIGSGGDVAASGNQLFFLSGTSCIPAPGTLCTVQTPITVTDYATNNANDAVNKTCSPNIVSLFEPNIHGPAPTVFFHMAAAGGFVYLIEDSPYAPAEMGSTQNPAYSNTAQANLFLVAPCGVMASYSYAFSNNIEFVGNVNAGTEATSIAADPQTYNAAFGSLGYKENSTSVQSLTLSAIEGNAPPNVQFHGAIPGIHLSEGMAYGW